MAKKNINKEKDKKKNVITLTKDNILYQPWKLVSSGYDASALQQNAVIAVLKKLKGALRSMHYEYMESARSGEGHHQTSLFDTKEASEFLSQDKNELLFTIHMSELGVDHNYYQRAFDAVRKIANVEVIVPQPDGSYDLKPLFTLNVSENNIVKDENGKPMHDENGNVILRYEARNPTVNLKLQRDIAETIFKDNMNTFLDETAMTISEKYPKRIYMYLASFKNNGYFEIDYWNFRKELGFNDSGEEHIMYPKWSDFKRRVLDPSVNVLKEMAQQGLSEYWFEYDVVATKVRFKVPDKLIFKIYLSRVGEDLEKIKESYKEFQAIADRLRSEFMQDERQITRIKYRLKYEDYDAFSRKLDELSYYFANTKKKIVSKKSYVNKTLTDFLDNSYSQPADAPVKNDEPVVTLQEPIEEKIEAKEPEVPTCTKEDLAKWNEFLERIRTNNDVKTYGFWSSGIKFVSETQDKLSIVFPNSFFMDEFKKRYMEEIYEAYRGVYGQEKKLNLNVNETLYGKIIERDKDVLSK